MGKIDYLVGEPLRRKNPSIGLLRISQILQDRTNGKSSLLIQKLCSVLKPKVDLDKKSELLNSEQMTQTVDSLNRLGWKILDFKLSADEVKELYDFAFKKPCWAVDINERMVLSPSAIPGKYGRYYWSMQDLIETKTVQRLLADVAFHKIAQEYIGCRPVFSSVSMWLDPVMDGSGGGIHKDGVYDPHIYHYDNDGPKFLKFFFYLTDVDKDSGAHCVIQGTQHPVKPDGFDRSKRYTDEELLSYYGKENEIVFEAPAGTIIAEDTMAFHKGNDPKKAFRLLMQFEYGLVDNLNVPEHNEEKIEKIKINGLDEQVAKIVGKYYY